MTDRRAYFMGYQAKWLADQSRFKIAEKSRRIGFTYVQAYEDTVDAAKAGGMDVWFTSADLSAAKEYIKYVEQWAMLLHHAAKHLGEVVVDEVNGEPIKALVVEFANGKRINALSSNPKNFRSKGGKVVIDEYAFHSDPDEMWKAASPSITWGFPIRVFSSHNGRDTRFYRMCEEALRDDSRWSHHRITIEDAIADGIVERVMRLDRPATAAEIDEFRASCRAAAGDDETYEQEYMCNPLDGTTQYISHELITACEHPDVPEPVVVHGNDVNSIPWQEYKPHVPAALAAILNPARRLYLGMDVARKRDLTVLWVDELVGDVSVTRWVWELHVMKFRHQAAHLRVLLPYVSRACLDNSGLGMQLAEDARDDFGPKVEEVTFNQKVKEDLAITTLRAFEDHALRNPKSEVVRKDFRKIKKLRTASGNARFEGERDKDGHADRFWARALARHAAVDSPLPPYAAARGVGRGRL